jgi:protein-S-isoprenylcysteine O-methyltransferase Ste14
MGDSWRIGVDPQETTGLVTSGVFTRVRNPIFTAMITGQAGTVLRTTSWLSPAGLALSSPGAICGSAELESPICERPTARPT